MRQILNYREMNDEMLVLLTLSRDEAAFEELVIRHRKAALLIAQQVTRNLYTAEDAVQDAFLTAWQRLDTLRDPSKFGPWVCRIARYRAINLAQRYRDYIPFDEVENYLEDPAEDISGYYDDRLETELLRACVEKLSEKIGTVIRLHYFEGLSISEIAAKIRLKEGTVKSRLSAGREQIRKELGYMDKNNNNETLVEAVMRRVEEFKEWRLKNSKVGFEEDYNDLMAQVEALPDSEKKFYAMADVMQLGMWYLPKTDGKDRIDRAYLREIAIKGGNKEVLGLCIGFDVDDRSGQDRVDYVYQTVIPELLKYGIPEQVAYHHFWLAAAYFDRKDWENARKEFALTLETGEGNPLYTALGRSALAALDETGDLLMSDGDYRWSCTAEEIIRRDSRLIFNQQPGFSRGWKLDAPDYLAHSYSPLYYASRADRLILDESMKPGDVVTDSEGKITLTCVAHDVTVETPCATFKNCVEIHTAEQSDWTPAPIFVAWYKRNIGLVASGWKKPEGEVFGRTVLTSFHLEGGLGYIPMATGNLWEYQTEGVMNQHVNRVEVTAVEGEKSYLSYTFYVKPTPFDESSWRANMLYARYHYCEEVDENHEKLVDISTYHARAAQLAATPWERKMTEVSRTVMERIFAGDLTVNPDAKRKGVWNFFVKEEVREENGVITLYDDRVFSFEWKDGGAEMWSALHNFIYDIMESSMGGIWNPAWLDYADRDEKFIYRRPCRTNDYPEFIGEAIVKTGVTVETRAGKFENCLHICTFSDTYEHGGLSYQCHKKDYYFADGIGLVRVKTEGGANPVYDLVSYEGTGEGYMPVCEGLTRHYEYVGNEARIHAGVIYHYIKDDDGKLCILSDQIGMVDV